MRVLCDEIDRAAWSKLVAESATGTWFQTPEAYDFCVSQRNIMEPFIFSVKSAQGLRGVCVGYVTKERSAFKQFFTRRAIIIGGPCLANDSTNDEIETLLNTIRNTLNKHAIYIETRNFNDYSRWREAFEKAGFAYQPHLNFHVDCSDEEEMWNKLSDNRKRQIKRAKANGATITEAADEQEIRAWYKILSELYRTKVRTPLFPLSFFIDFYNNGLGKYLLVKYEGKIIGGIMCPIMASKCVYEWFVCGDDVQYKNQYPSVMATYAAMEYACKQGISRFDFMGAGKRDEAYGVRDFKARFGGQEVEHGRFLYICKPALYKLGEIGVKILRR